MGIGSSSAPGKNPPFCPGSAFMYRDIRRSEKGGAVVSFEGFPPGVRIANAFVSYIIYIGKTIWPNNLAVFYPHPGSWPLWQVLGAVLLLIAVTFAVIRTAKRLPYLAVGWLWFAGTLVPVIGIVQVGRSSHG